MRLRRGPYAAAGAAPIAGCKDGARNSIFELRNFLVRILRAFIFLTGAGCRFECKTVPERGRLGGWLLGLVHCSGPPRLIIGKRLRPTGQLVGKSAFLVVFCGVLQAISEFLAALETGSGIRDQRSGNRETREQGDLGLGFGRCVVASLGFVELFWELKWSGRQPLREFMRPPVPPPRRTRDRTPYHLSTVKQ